MSGALIDELAGTEQKVGADRRAETEIRQLEIEWGTAYLQRDMAALDRIMAVNYIFTNPLGEVSNKAQNLTAIKSNHVRFESTESDDVQVYIHGDTAVVTARSRFKGSYKGWGIGGRYQYTDVFVKQNGHWRAVASQVTLVGRGLLRLRLGRFISDCGWKFFVPSRKQAALRS
jgi:ketosteroid isomerase-like protein